jgi:FkbM family methyltransferase
MSFSERLIVTATSYIISERTAFRMARALLATQGVGWAGPGNGLRGSGEARFLKNYIGPLYNPCVFDIGANIGDYSEAALEVNPNARLHLFEPSHVHLKLLRERLPVEKVVINPFGLSETAENRLLHKDCEVTGLASLISRDLSHLNIHLDKVEDVKLESGDAYVARQDIERIDLMKIDVEGWELSVLKGFSESFSRKIVRCCQFEFGHAHIERRENFRDFYRFFMDLGFTLGVLKPNGTVLQMKHYDEIFENYYATNYVAKLKG